jgi:hypothetical protein
MANPIFFPLGLEAIGMYNARIETTQPAAADLVLTLIIEQYDLDQHGMPKTNDIAKFIVPDPTGLTEPWLELQITERGNSKLFGAHNIYGNPSTKFDAKLLVELDRFTSRIYLKGTETFLIGADDPRPKAGSVVVKVIPFKTVYFGFTPDAANPGEGLLTILSDELFGDFKPSKPLTFKDLEINL